MNNELKCIIVDDEPLAVRLLESYVEKTPDLQLMASFTDSITAINAIKAQKPDLLFLDIQMPNIDGMELAHSLPEETRVVFTTAFKEYAFESYEVNALDFLLKPIRYNKFLAAVDKAKKLHQQWSTVNGQSSMMNTVFIRVDGEWRNVPIRQWHEGLRSVLSRQRTQGTDYPPDDESRRGHAAQRQVPTHPSLLHHCRRQDSEGGPQRLRLYRQGNHSHP